MPSVSHQTLPQSDPPLETTELQQYKTDTKLYELLQKTRMNPDFNKHLGDEILEELYDFSLDCSFFAKQSSDGKFILPSNLPTVPPEQDNTDNSQGPHPGMIKIPNPQSCSQPGSSYSTPQQQQQWSYQQPQQPGSSMQKPQMAGPSGQQSMTPSTPLPIHPPEFHRFNLQAPIKHAMPSGATNSQQMRSPFYPPPSMTPEQQQMYLHQQQQQQKNGGGPGSVLMMSPVYSQVPTPQSQHNGQFSRQSSFKMNTPQPMIRQDNPLQPQNSVTNKQMHQQQQATGYIHSQQDPYFQGRIPHQIQRIDSNDNEMKPPLIPKHENGMDHRIPLQQQQRMNGVMGQQYQHFHNDLTSPKYQIKNDLMSPQGRPLSTTSLISSGIQQSPLQANGQPMSSIGQTNVSPLVAITPPIGDGSPGCSSFASVLASKPQSKSILAHAMDDPHRSTASPASEASTASTSSRKRVAEEDAAAPKVIIKRPRCNPKNMPYTNLLNFIMKYLPQTPESRMIPYICNLLLEHVKSSKRVLEWKDEARTFTISKPRVFADRFKDILGLPDSSREVSTTKMETDMDKKLSKLMIGNHQLIQRIDQKTKTYMFLCGFQESPSLRENKTQLDLNQSGRIIEFPSTPMSAGTQSSFPPPIPNYSSGAPITA
uniref:Uncharacterized protein n=1 Tax=Panagrolaimus superbus TaxID=310955 RepID=A0A914Z4S8_9BILA